MDMDTYKKFETKLGYCHVLPDRLILTEQSTLVQHIEEYKETNKLPKAHISYLAIVLLLALKSYTAFKDYKFVRSGASVMVILGYIIFIIYNINITTTPMIPKKSIVKIKFKKGTKWLTRARLVVHYKSKKGTLKKRLILFPGALFKGDTKSKEAIDILIKANYLTVHQVL
ncbi:hypothetical protein NBRC110019_20320 [Neptunitalea chrysea]|uniref:Uncharacterized protein n=2 Tax=Neptunitalea chrysea TaxID=1647581 RepID=A0A9W6B7W4_9FLAO|nr:hypothetical protein NBRC110019_20320 [Neptunitalea chrysea]